MRRAATPPAIAALPLLIVGAVFAWWAWKNGAYFGVVFLPGAMILLLLVGALLLFAPWPGKLSGAPRVALLSLLVLATLTLASALWSPTPDVAIADAQRVLGYGAVFGIGMWLCLLLGRRLLLALAPLAGAGAVVALLTLIVLWSGSSTHDFFETDATLRYPLGYRNAVAAFFVMALFPMIVLAASRELDWRLRGGLVGAATISIELVVLAQSRASALAALIAVATLFAVHPYRFRVAVWLSVAAIPAALALPWLLDVFQEDAGNSAAELPPLHAACRVMFASMLISVIGGCTMARRDPRFELSPERARLAGRGLMAVLTVVLVVASVKLANSEGGPLGFVSQHARQINAGDPNLSSQGTRYGLDLRSGRGGFWRVALDDFADRPLAGEGAGGFRTSYLLHRHSATLTQPEDPHSIELLMASELGLPGLLLLTAFMGGCAVAATRAWRLGPSAAALVAASAAMGAYWLVHASVDWFWPYPAITAPVMLAMGSAAAPALLRSVEGTPVRRRLGAAIAVGLIAATFIPFFLSERYTNSALRGWQGDLEGAYSQLHKAADLNPTSIRPMTAEAVIAERVGDRGRALATLDRAQRRQPDEWTVYYLKARVLSATDPVRADQALARARALNPRGPEIAALEQQLR
jgi:hypothetical protein